jgi:hypothetical protein
VIQISTWNDWGEGTVIEPSTEFGYRDLEVVQRLRRQFIEPGFPGKPEDLRMPIRLYNLRKGVGDRRPSNRELQQVSQLLSQRECKVAAETMGAIEMRRQRGRRGPLDPAGTPDR